MSVIYYFSVIKTQHNFRKNMTLRMKFLVIAITASLFGCGEENASPSTSNDQLEPAETQPEPETQPETSPNSNILGEALIKGYGGSYSLPCKTGILDNEKTVNKTLVIDKSGIKFDGDVLFKALEKGALHTVREDRPNYDGMLISPPKESSFDLASIGYDEKTGSEYITVSSTKTDDTIIYSCPISFSNYGYFGKNLGEVLNKYVKEPINVECIDYANVGEFFTGSKSGPKTDMKFYIDNDYSAHVGNMIYYGSDFKTNHFVIQSAPILDSKGKVQTQYTSSNEITFDSPNSDHTSNYFQVYFNEKDQLTALIINTPDTQGIRTCGPK